MAPAENRPLRPEGDLDDSLVDLVTIWRGYPALFRAMTTLYLGVGGFGGLYGGYLLTEARGDWLGWSLALLVLEPAGLACCLGVVFLVCPGWVTGSLLSRTLSKARLALATVGAAVTAVLTVGVGYAAYEVWVRPLAALIWDLRWAVL